MTIEQILIVQYRWNIFLFYKIYVLDFPLSYLRKRPILKKGYLCYLEKLIIKEVTNLGNYKYVTNVPSTKIINQSRFLLHIMGANVNV